jgi:hypothetical protein
VKKVILIILGLFLAILIFIAVITSFVTNKGLDECFFGVCCTFLYIIGNNIGLSYKEICVISNIYIESGICLISGVWVTWTAIKRFLFNKTITNSVLMSFLIIYGMAYMVGELWICWHYNMPMDDAFDLCFHELCHLATKYNTTYNNVNYVIFIILFLVITIGNVLIVKLLDNRR